MNSLRLFPILVILLFFNILQVVSISSNTVEHVLTRTTPYHYVYDDFRSHNCSQGKFLTNDTTYDYIYYDVKENIVSNGISICNENTFLLLLFFVHRMDTTRRDLVRRYIHQGMVVGNVSINYAFVVCADKEETGIMTLLEKEGKEHGDLLISVHVDSYSNVTLTVLDSFLWVRDHCKEAVFVGRIDGDTWINMKNLAEYLQTVNRTRYYGGYYCEAVLRTKASGTRYYVPNDYPPKRWVYNSGGAYVVSRDVVPYINIGTLFIDLIVHAAEDAMIGDILRRVEILPYRRENNYVLYSNLEWFPNGTIPSNAIFVHNIKNYTLLANVYEGYL